MIVSAPTMGGEATNISENLKAPDGTSSCGAGRVNRWAEDETDVGSVILRHAGSHNEIKASAGSWPRMMEGTRSLLRMSSVIWKQPAMPRVRARAHRDGPILGSKGKVHGD
jgi:hypothetical protein